MMNPTKPLLVGRSVPHEVAALTEAKTSALNVEAKIK